MKGCKGFLKVLHLIIQMCFMRHLLLVSLILLTTYSKAQPPAGANRGGGGQGMNMGRFYGKVVDAKTNKPVDAASVQLIQSKFDTVQKKRIEAVVSGQLTAANGDFSLENLPVMAQFKLRISAIGYEAYEQPLKFDIKPGGDMSQMMNAVDRDLGNIKLNIDAKQLETITVTGTKPFMQMGVDRRIFNVEKSLVSQGQTATELMRNIPGLNVDIDGNVTLRNATPTIFVDGRPTTLTLDQIPADAIASVEMITNPSAKYDASGGMAGILNIVLKKNRKAGYNGNLRGGIDSRAKINLGGDINVRQGKVNMFLSGMYNQRKSIGEGKSVRTETYYDPNVRFVQQNNPIGIGSFMFLRGGFDYFIDNRNTITISANIVRGNFDNSDRLDIRTDTLTDPITSSLSQRTTSNDFFFRNNNFALGYKRLFKKPGMELTSDMNYSMAKNGSDGGFRTDYYDADLNPKGIPVYQTQNGKGNNKFFTFQSDYVNPFKDNKSKVETGVRAQVRDVRNENLNYIQNPVTGELVPIAQINANFKYREQVFAAYGTYSSKIGENFSYQVGLRAESSRYDGTLLTDGSSFSNSFPISFFPSVFLTKKLKNSDLQLNYSRRINRPNFFQLMPFVDYTDSLNINRGNPNLVPEFTNSFEISYQKNLKNNHSLLFSTWFKHTDDLITRYQIKEPSSIPGRDVIINTYVNANSSRAYGLEVTSRNPLTKWLDATTNLNFFNSKINTENISDSVAQIGDLWSFFGKLNLAFKLPKNWSIQLSGDYQSKAVLPQGGGRGGGGGGRGGGPGGGGGFGGFVQTTAQGYVKPSYAADFAIRKEFMKDKRASASLSVNDIFKTRRYATFSESQYFTQDFERRQDWRVVRLNMAFRFGKFDTNLFKRKNNRSGQDGMNEGIQMQQ
jgi:outer membrane receptor protein involved in Fe transport